MKKILVLVLVATMMLTAFLALSAAKDATKSTTSMNSITPGSEVNNSTKKQITTTPSLEPTNLTTNKTTMAPVPDVNKSPTTTTPGSEPASTAASATTNTTTPGFESGLGLEGMLQWLDQPVNNFPWYSSGGSFYSQGYSEGTFSPFREFYTTSGACGPENSRNASTAKRIRQGPSQNARTIIFAWRKRQTTVSASTK